MRQNSRMSLDEAERIIELQHRIVIRLAELGYADAVRRVRRPAAKADYRESNQ